MSASQSPTQRTTLHFDIAIIGAGPVGMSLALALAGSAYRVCLIDRQSQASLCTPTADTRVLALSAGSRQLLSQLSAWDEQATTAIHDIHISQRNGFGRSVLQREECALPALGYVVSYRALLSMLAARLSALGAFNEAEQPLRVLTQRQVEHITTQGEGILIELSSTQAELATQLPQTLCAQLLVHAEGHANYANTQHTNTQGERAFDSAHKAAQQSRTYDYAQHALLAEVRTAQAHQNRAWERFTPDGPLALLPHGEHYALVYTLPSERAAQVLALDEAAFLATLQNSFAHAFSSRLDFIAASARSSFPLSLRLRPKVTATRQVWIGNSAQTLHPVAGQGFNLGLRDAWSLAEVLQNHRYSDLGEASLLARYARSRCLDRYASVGFTDGMVRLFSNDLAPLRLARGIGLWALDSSPALRQFVAKRMIWGARAW
ncbi:MAG: FAD-dependent monooxygenase [Pseudomonadota bacterium]